MPARARMSGRAAEIGGTGFCTLQIRRSAPTLSASGSRSDGQRSDGDRRSGSGLHGSESLADGALGAGSVSRVGVPALHARAFADDAESGITDLAESLPD